jgi:hypothetical protein
VRGLVLILVLTMLSPATLAAQEGVRLDRVLAMTPQNAPVAMGRPHMETGAGQSLVEPSLRQRRVILDGPAVLDKPHTRYVLGADISVPASAFRIRASHVTLDLDGHTVVYGQREKGEGVNLDKWWLEDVEVVNGTIRQGGARTAGDVHGRGSNPVFALSARDLVLAGLHLEWSGRDVAGIFVRGSQRVRVHHCTLVDMGDGVTNRHQGIESINVNGEEIEIDHVRIRGARQNGIRAFKARVHHNDVAVESVCTNSTAISVSHGIIAGNRITGKGTHPIGIWPGPGTKVYSNYVEVANTADSAEYGSAGAAGLRTVWGKNNGVEAFGNTFLVRAARGALPSGGDSWGRALFVGTPNPDHEIRFHHNIIVAVNQGRGAKAAAVGVVSNNESPHLKFTKNIIASNWGPLLLGDDYGSCGGFPFFAHNRILRLRGGEDFHTIRSGYRDYASTALFADNTFEGGARPRDVDFELPSPALKELRFARQVRVVVRDPDGNPVHGARLQAGIPGGPVFSRAVTDAEGKADLSLVYRRLVGRVASPGLASILAVKIGLAGEGMSVENVDALELRIEASGLTVAKTLSAQTRGPVEVVL